MSVTKIWDGSQYKRVTPAVLADGSFTTPQSMYTWDGSSFTQVWPLPPAFDSAGAGFGGSSAAPFWPHLGIEGDALVVLAANWSAVTSMTASVGGVIMDLLGVSPIYNMGITGAGGGIVRAFGLLDPPTGDQTVNLTCDTAATIAAESLSYKGVAGFGTVSTAVGAGSLPSLTVTSGVDQMVATAMSLYTGGGYQSTATTRFSLPYQGGKNVAFTASDAPGADSVTFKAVSSQTYWGGIAVPLLGA